MQYFRKVSTFIATSSAHPQLLQKCFSPSTTFKPIRKMSLNLVQVLERLENFAPLSLAEKWDNVGLLVDPMNTKPIAAILLTNDLTEDVVDEAIKEKVQLIISYHPNIFQGLKSVSASKSWKERIVVRCIQNDIAVFSPHTSWDSVQGGVNDWLASAFQYATSKPIQARPDNAQQGAGRLLTLETPLILQTAIDKIKDLVGLKHLRFALGKGGSMESSLVKTVALCAGSGHSVLSGVEADLYLTGEMLHHDVLDATQRGIHVVLCNHSDSERGFLRSFQYTLQDKLLNGETAVLVSDVDCDPLATV